MGLFAEVNIGERFSVGMDYLADSYSTPEAQNMQNGSGLSVSCHGIGKEQPLLGSSSSVPSQVVQPPVSVAIGNIRSASVSGIVNSALHGYDSYATSQSESVHVNAARKGSSNASDQK